MERRLSLFEAVAIIAATVIGAGVLGVPYVFSLNNFFSSSLILAAVGLGMLLTMLFWGEITLRTEGEHQICGYTEIYLGRVAKWFQALVLIFGLYGAMLAYTIGQGEILSSLFGSDEIFWIIAFYLVFTVMLIRGLALVKRAELVLTLILFSVLVILSLSLAGRVDPVFWRGWSWEEFLLSYGVLLFACSGVVAVPHARNILVGAGETGRLRQAIVWGMLLPVVLYFIFALVVVGVNGLETTPIATIGLGAALGPAVTLLGSLFAFFAMATSFISIGLALRETFRRDLGFSYGVSSGLVLLVPLALYFFVSRDFINVLSVVGSLGMGLGGILTVFIFWSARRRGRLRPAFAFPDWLARGAGFGLLLMYFLGIAWVFLGP